MASKQLGRPPFPPDKTRSERVVTFVTPTELEQLQRLATSKDLAVSAAVHQIISSELKK
ncbi:MAG: hypothetical protein ABJL54_02775 [Halioglobus sp.]